MQYLLLAILFNIIISSIFKIIPRYHIDMLQAVVANYCVCVITGCIFIGHMPFTASAVHENWFPWALLTGLAFILIFNLLGYSTRIEGLPPLLLPINCHW